jgi:hypothetical protein
MLDSENNILDANVYIQIEVDDGIPHSNPNGADYFELRVRVLDTEFDLEEFQIFLYGYDENNYYYNENDLLNTTSNPNYPGVVDYFLKINCGDLSPANDDVGHNNTSVGIYPRAFNYNDGYHTVYFRWYINEDLWYEMESIYLDAVALDWDGNEIQVTNIPLATCIGCNPPLGVPDPPTLVSVAYSHLNSNIRLEWDEAEGSAEAKFFRIYNAWLRKI